MPHRRLTCGPGLLPPQSSHQWALEAEKEECPTELWNLREANRKIRKVETHGIHGAV